MRVLRAAPGLVYANHARLRRAAELLDISKPFGASAWRSTTMSFYRKENNYASSSITNDAATLTLPVVGDYPVSQLRLWDAFADPRLVAHDGEDNAEDENMPVGMKFTFEAAPTSLA